VCVSLLTTAGVQSIILKKFRSPAHLS
jgi:hypothetical protein